MRKVLVTGALGQIGSELVPALRARYGSERVIASDQRMLPAVQGKAAAGLYVHIDCTQPDQFHEAVRRHDVGTIHHLAALLSAVAEDKPQIAWAVNMGGLYNVLEVERQDEYAVFFSQLYRRLRPLDPVRRHAPDDDSAADNDVWGDEGVRRSRIAGQDQSTTASPAPNGDGLHVSISTQCVVT